MGKISYLYMKKNKDASLNGGGAVLKTVRCQKPCKFESCRIRIAQQVGVTAPQVRILSSPSILISQNFPEFAWMGL